MSDRDRRLVAAFGPRGLSSLLLALLPVFAGMAGGERIFMLTAVVVLLSVVVPGGGTAYFLRKSAAGQRVECLLRVTPATPEVISDRDAHLRQQLVDQWRGGFERVSAPGNRVFEDALARTIREVLATSPSRDAATAVAMVALEEIRTNVIREMNQG